MKLTKDARIYTHDGKDVGNLNRFVMDPRSKQITHIVFETGLLGSREYVAPMQLVDYTDDSGIHLGPLPVDSVEDLPAFEEERYIVTDEDALLAQGFVSEDRVDSYYYYPPAPFGGAGIMRPEGMYQNTPPGLTPHRPAEAGIPVSGDSGVIRQTDQNIPDGTVALKEGARVLTSDHKHVGDVEKVVVDTGSARATHLLLTKGLLFKERKLIPADWVDSVAEDEVTLCIDERFAEKLPDYQERS